jgi:hypothetical protein
MSNDTDLILEVVKEGCPSLEQTCIDYIVSLCVIGSAFIISEALPFLRQVQGNSIADCLVKTFETSECCLSKIIDCLKKDKNEDANSAEVTTKLNTKQEQEMKNNNAININIGADLRKIDTEPIR